MHYHTESEHENNRVHIEVNGFGQVQDIENAVVSEIDDQRVDSVVFRFSHTDKNVVDDGAACISDVEGDKLHDDQEDLLGILQVLSISEKRCP